MMGATWHVQVTLRKNAAEQRESACFLGVLELALELQLNLRSPNILNFSLKIGTRHLHHQLDGPLPDATRLWFYDSNACSCWSDFSFLTGSDVSSSRTLRTTAFTDLNDMTIEACIAFCTPAGYQYAGVEYGRVRFSSA